jgi:hypothetical protein
MGLMMQGRVNLAVSDGLIAMCDCDLHIQLTGLVYLAGAAIVAILCSCLAARRTKGIDDLNRESALHQDCFRLTALVSPLGWAIYQPREEL